MVEDCFRVGLGLANGWSRVCRGLVGVGLGVVQSWSGVGLDLLCSHWSPIAIELTKHLESATRIGTCRMVGDWYDAEWARSRVVPPDKNESMLLAFASACSHRHHLSVAMSARPFQMDKGSQSRKFQFSDGIWNQTTFWFRNPRVAGFGIPLGPVLARSPGFRIRNLPQR